MSFFNEGIDLNKVNEAWLANIDHHLGLKMMELSDSEKSLEARFTVSEHSIQPFGLLHGGVSCLVAESVASLAGNLCVEKGLVVVGQSLTANHIRSGRVDDEVLVKAVNVHKGRTSQIWNVCLSSGDKILAQVTLTLAVIQKPTR